MAKSGVVSEIPSGPSNGDNIRREDFAAIIQQSFATYGLAVVTDRALPDARDGLKPVQRRILYCMHRQGYRSDRSFVKSAAVVGDTLKFFHPHGDVAVYDAAARLAQDFNLRYPLVAGQGNFGCFTGDTRIKLLDGTEKTFAELAQLPKDEIFHVYSVDKSGRIVVGEGRYSRITRRNAEIIELTFDDGSTVRCTPDHKFMLRDRSWKEAKDLTVDDSLMAGYFDTAQINSRTREYLRVKQPLTGQWEFVHRLADEYNVQHGRVAATVGPFVRHPINGNRLDNRQTDKREVMRTKIAGFGARIVAELGAEGLTPEIWDDRRNANWIPNSNNVLRYFAGFDELREVVATHNHRVVSIRTLGENVDVYDITVNEHHNFMLANGVVCSNSSDGDSPAAYRYTEMRLSSVGEALLANIDKDTVPMHPSYLQDPKVIEPDYLPGCLPPIVNPSTGIAVGLSTSIPPHNLREVVDACVALLDNPQLPVADLLKFVKGPDFPLGGIIVGTDGIRDYLTTGKGRIVVRADVRLEETPRASYLVITQIPPVPRSRVRTSIATAINERKIEGLVPEIRDESDVDKGVRIVLELKRDAQPAVVLNQLYKHTDLQISVSAQMVLLFGEPGKPARQPRQANVRDILHHFNEHQLDVTRRRLTYELNKCERRLHIVKGLIIGAQRATEVVRIFRGSADRAEAKATIREKFKLDEIQADVIASMTLAEVTRLDENRFIEEKKELEAEIARLRDLLASPAKIVQLVKDDLHALAQRFGDARRTAIDVNGKEEVDDVASLIEYREIVIVLSRDGYVKTVPASVYRPQRRGGRGVSAGMTRADDAVIQLTTASTHASIIALTNQGRFYLLPAHRLPSGSRTSRGEAIRAVLPLQAEETVRVLLATEQLTPDRYLVIFTRNGKVKKTPLSEYRNVHAGGLNDINLLGDDQVVDACLAGEGAHYLVTTSDGNVLRFADEDLRPTGRGSQGVAAIKLRDNATVVGGSCIAQDDSRWLCLINRNGVGKRTSLGQFSVKGRNGGGIVGLNVEGSARIKPSRVAASIVVDEDADVVISTEQGMAIRVPVSSISIQDRATRGTNIINLGKNEDFVTTIAAISGS